MSALFRQRIDTRSAGKISDALAGGTNGRGRFVAMVVEKREKANRIFLTVDDYDDEATVLVGDSNPSVWQTARRISRDQVLFLETRKSSGKLLVAENIVLPEIPDHRPGRASDELYAVLISDVHVGSKVFMEDAFGRVLGWLKGEVGGPDQRHIADRVKYVIIGGGLVEGVGGEPPQEMGLYGRCVFSRKCVAEASGARVWKVHAYWSRDGGLAGRGTCSGRIPVWTYSCAGVGDVSWDNDCE